MITGGCACGRVRYTATATTQDVGWCACRTCQRSVGAPMVAWATFAPPPDTEVPALPLHIDGPAAWTRSSRRADRGFCAACGTSLFWRGSDGRAVDVTLASLDDPRGLTPTHVIHAADAPPWCPLPPGLPVFSGAPGTDGPDAVAALDWIADLLERRGVPYRISGGLAARAYGADRPLADIDIDVPDAALTDLLPELAPFVTFGPARYQDDRWDLLLCTLDHHGQAIDLCGGDTCRIRDGAGWRDDPFRPAEVVTREVLGRACPVVPLDALRAYKILLGRPVDRADIALLDGIHLPA